MFWVKVQRKKVGRVKLEMVKLERVKLERSQVIYEEGEGGEKFEICLKFQYFLRFLSLGSLPKDDMHFCTQDWLLPCIYTSPAPMKAKCKLHLYTNRIKYKIVPWLILFVVLTF